MKSIYITAKNLSVAILVILGFTNTYGQERKHEFSVSAAGIFSSIGYDLEGGDLKHDYGGGFGIRYSYYLSESWSIGIGGEYQWYKSTAEFDNFSDAYTTTDVENESFEFRYSGIAYREKQRAQYVNIPLTFQYESSGDDLIRWYITGGVKAGIAINTEYETSISSINTSGYYPQYDAELFGPAFMGFGQFNEINTGKREFDAEMSWSGTIETGIKQAVGQRGWAYLGIFLDYGFTKIYEGGNKNLIGYPQTMPADLEYNSVLDTPLAKDARLIAYGFKFRMAIN